MGEPFLDDRFRMHNRNQAFLQGFGKEVLTPVERRRIAWYDLLLYATMITEVAYRVDESDVQERWVRPLFGKTWQALTDAV